MVDSLSTDIQMYDKSRSKWKCQWEWYGDRNAIIAESWIKKDPGSPGSLG
ncbi:MAG: hypothetical protein HC851_05295 [Acaryochloris sp. RU_4_1]|nr:hypothetical protein [Acaryochloris sp. RU_4_1]NJR53855.1 hypothetical protein [Acaryochloris sp. CRU_2_0]